MSCAQFFLSVSDHNKKRSLADSSAALRLSTQAGDVMRPPGNTTGFFARAQNRDGDCELNLGLCLATESIRTDETGRVAESRRLSGKRRIIKCFSLLSSLRSRTCCSPSHLQLP